MSKSQYREPYETHNLFVLRLSSGKVKELLYRSDPLFNNHILRNDIVNELKLLDNSTRVNNIETSISNDCHIYITYLDVNKKEIGHLSLHIDLENKQLSYYTKKAGRFHYKNTIKNKYYTIRFNTNNQKQNYSLNYYSNNDKFDNFIKASLIVLKEYFNKNSNLSLDLNRSGLRYNQNIKHICFPDIKKKLNKSYKYKLKNTQKTTYKHR